MKKVVIAVLTLCMACMTACQRTHVNPPTPPVDSTTEGVIKLNLISSEPYWPDSARTNIELIVSESGGNVLLDTITPANTHITASLSTKATTVNLTNIYYDALKKIYVAQTYLGVNPSGWAGDYSLSYYNPYGPRPADIIPDTITFTNLPSQKALVFSQNPFTGVNQNIATPNTAIEIDSIVPGNYAYLLCPTTGQSKMVIPDQSKETVDCSTMDQAASGTFSPSSYFTHYFTNIYGYLDSTNQNSQIWLYINDYVADSTLVNTLPQLLYPTKNIQKYAVTAAFSHGIYELAQWYACSDVVNTNITYPDPGSYTLAATQNTQFALNWNSAKPTYYTTYWGDATVSWTIYSSPDSTMLNPVGLLTAQKSKLLQGQDLTKLTFGEFTFETVNGYNYPGFLGLINDSTQLWKTLVSGGVSYYKYF
jgi:hypothetical protein